MPDMRAKVKLQTVTATEGSERLDFVAVAKTGSYPADGSDEDNTYAKFSPAANFTIQVNNQDLHGKFKAGRKYYVDFTEAEA